MSLLRDMKLMSRDKSVDLTGVLSCRETLLESLRHNHLRLDIITPLVGKETPIHFMSFRLVSIRYVQFRWCTLREFRTQALFENVSAPFFNFPLNLAGSGR